MNIIYVHEDLKRGIKGRLSQGGWRDVDNIIQGHIDSCKDVTCVVLAACDYQPPNIPKCPTIIRVDLIDTDQMTDDEKQSVLETCQDVAKRVADMVRNGHHALVTCWAGLNRSGLISALTLIELGKSPPDAIEIVRKGRSAHALCNDQFVELILSLGCDYCGGKGYWVHQDASGNPPEQVFCDECNGTGRNGPRSA